jgi:tetratricopeptide (TPR) repeat protein
MFKRLTWSIAILSLAVTACAADLPDADVALASRVSDLGTGLLRQKHVTAADYDACAALLKAAARLNPSDPRYPQLLVEDCLAEGDTDGAIEALNMYRRIKPDDLGAQVELIQLNLSKMETADAKLKYTQQILGATKVSPDVRSAVALTCAKLLSERGQTEEAEHMLSESLRLNNLNVEALRLRYQHDFATLSEYEKVQSLINMIKANPLQPTVVAEFSERLADFGLVKQSLDWYFNAIRLYQKQNNPVPMDLAIDYAAEQYLAERYDGADGMAIRLLQSDPYNIDALYIRLVCAEHAHLPDIDRRMRNYARQTMLARLTGVRDAIDPAATQPSSQPSSQPAAVPTASPATSPIAVPPELSLSAPAPGSDQSDTAPAQVPAGDSSEFGLPTTLPAVPDVTFNVDALPDLSGAVAKVTADKQSPRRTALTSAVVDMAWYSLYFDPQPAVTQVMLDTLAKLVPADNVTLVRLQGWNLLKQNKPDQAKVKLSAIADRDPMAEVGLITLAPPTDPVANNRGRKLLSANPSGMLGVFIKETLRDRGIKVAASDKAQALSDQLEKFQTRWLDVIDNPKEFYLIRGVPTQGQFDYHEPVLVNVTIQNLSDFDITVGPEGVLRNDLWIDAAMPIPPEKKFPGTAYDRITQQLVLRSRQSMSKVIRVDQGALAKALNDDPTAPQQVWVTVLTNPTSTPQGVGAGPGGYRVQLNKMIARAGFAILSDTEVDKLLKNLTEGTFGKISNIDLIGEYLKQAAANPSDERLAALKPKFEEKLVAVRVDPSASVRGWSQFTLTRFISPTSRAQQIQEMSRSQEWSTRLLAAVAAARLDASAGKPILQELAKDSDAVVKDYAAAMLQAAATTRPTTAPTTQP